MYILSKLLELLTESFQKVGDPHYSKGIKGMESEIRLTRFDS